MRTWLKVDATMYNQVAFNKQPKQYLITGLHPNCNYEVRVSYPSVIPTDFELSVEMVQQENLEERQSTHQSRKILNNEKTVVAGVNTNVVHVITVIAHRTGKPMDRKMLDDPVIFNIVVNRLYMGLTLDSIKMLSLVLLLIVLTVKYVVPWMFLYMDSLLVQNQKEKCKQ